MRACKNELRTGAANFAASIDVGSTSITNSATTQSQPCVLHLPEHECVGTTVMMGRFGAELRSPVDGSFQYWRVLL